MRHADTGPWKRLALKIFGGASIVTLSFVATLYVMDRVESTIELDTDRQGGDYRSLVQPTITIESCVNECKWDSACQSWTLVRNGILGPEMACLLKKEASQPIKNSCCTSGKVSRSIDSFFE
jgi:hypothetical protein